MRNRLFTSEAVTEGHPGTIADPLSDTLFDAHPREDPAGRVTAETLTTTGPAHLGCGHRRCGRSGPAVRSHVRRDTRVDACRPTGRTGSGSSSHSGSGSSSGSHSGSAGSSGSRSGFRAGSCMGPRAR